MEAIGHRIHTGCSGRCVCLGLAATQPQDPALQGRRREGSLKSGPWRWKSGCGAGSGGCEMKGPLGGRMQREKGCAPLFPRPRASSPNTPPPPPPPLAALSSMSGFRNSMTLNSLGNGTVGNAILLFKRQNCSGVHLFGGDLMATELGPCPRPPFLPLWQSPCPRGPPLRVFG